MCLILFAYEAHPQYPFIVAANRDEFYDRPSKAAHFWPDHPHLLAGRDLKQSGTWMGVTKQGEFAAVTNYRDVEEESKPKSRGQLITDYLTEPLSPETYMQHLLMEKDQYQGFNLLVGNRRELYYYSNRNSRAPQRLQPGIYGLSNEFLDTPWPKVERGKQQLKALLYTNQTQYAAVQKLDLIDGLFEVLFNTDIAPDEQLPHTGVPLDWERALSASFIEGKKYGTRASTVLLMDRIGEVTFVEKSYDHHVYEWKDRSFAFKIKT